MQIGAKSWDFQSRSAFLAFGSVTFVEWTQHLPESDRLGFAIDVLDRYQGVACDAPGEENFFRFTRWTSPSPPLTPDPIDDPITQTGSLVWSREQGSRNTPGKGANIRSVTPVRRKPAGKAPRPFRNI